MELGLKGKIAIVTGGASGFGRATAEALAREGAAAWIADFNGKAAEDAAAALRNLGLPVEAVAVDVGDAGAVERAFAGVEAKAGRIDILVGAAGLLSVGPVAELPASEWDRVSRVNVAGLLNGIKAVLPGMMKRKYGRIINIASVSAMRGGGSLGNVLYGATKAAVVAMSMGLARELGPHGITVNALAPSLADTAMTHQWLDEPTLKRVLSRIPVGRMADVREIADLIVFVASERAAFLTGGVIPIDGGILTT